MNYQKPKPNLNLNIVQLSDIQKYREALLVMKSERIEEELADTFLDISISVMDVWIAIIEDIKLFKEGGSIEFSKAYKYINDVDVLCIFSGSILLSVEVRAQIKELLYSMGWSEKMSLPSSSVVQFHGFALSYLTFVISVK